MPLHAVRLKPVEDTFGIEAAGRLLLSSLPSWMQDLGLLVEAVETGRPAGAPADWQPGAVIRLPFSKNVSRNGLTCPQALLATAETAMTLACAAALNGYQPISIADQTMHFVRPVSFDVLADARVVRIARNTSFGRVTLSSAIDQRPVGMVTCAYAIL
jgi:acyl-coenzyme A thioesterase PaaI-like protein